MYQAHRIRKVYSNANVNSEVLATGFIITVDDEIDKLTSWSHPYDESVVKLPFGGNVSHHLPTDSLFHSSFYHRATFRLPGSRKERR